jgi:membrane protease YdiL (CAAX protease family)
MDNAETPTKHRGLGYGPVAAVLVAVGVYFASQLFVAIMISLVGGGLLGWDRTRLENFLTDSVYAQFAALVAVEAITLWLIWQFLRARRVALGQIGLVGPRVRDVGYSLVGYFVYFASFVATSIFAKILVPGLNLDQEQEIGFSRNTSGTALVFVFASLVVLPPIAEEIVARGFLYTGLRGRLPKITAAIITSILFAAAHLQWGSGNALLWVAALDTFVLSMILVYLREKTGSLWPSIGVHMLKNCLAFTLLFIFKP